MWAQINQKVGDHTLAGLTQDYGERLAYWGWKTAANWPQYGDLIYRKDRGGNFDFDETFAELTANKDYFLVTDFDQLKKQPLLKEKLSQYPVIFSADGYTIFDLRAQQ
jgi:hypothetical protein